jgi:ring-1,2-phenylacetyl-CoA epoxidase subunit PaaC
MPPTEIDPALAAVVLALADDELIIGHRHSEWLGLSPFLEEDLAMASIAQDELGHARALYAALWPSWTDRDASITLRAASDWRCCALVELDARPWERHLVRHVLYDVLEGHRWRALTEHDSPAAGVAERALDEERWHRRHATDLWQRLAPENSVRMQGQIDALFPFVSTLIDGLSEPQRTAALDDLKHVITTVGLAAPEVAAANGAGRLERTPAFAEIHRSLTEVAAIDPSASW